MLTGVAFGGDRDGAPSDIISVKEARKLLGSQFSSVPDSEIEVMIVMMQNLSAKLIDWQNGSTKSDGVL